MLGVHAGGAARAFPYEAVERENLILDRVGSEPVLLVVGPDNQSVRVFSRARPGGKGVADFYRTNDGANPMLDSLGGSKWNFQGCAGEGPAPGACLAPIDALKDYWFDWREYNPGTTVYGIAPRP